MRRTQVAIIGGGPAGILLSHLLRLEGVDSVVLERQRKAMCSGASAPACWSPERSSFGGAGLEGGWTARATLTTAAGSSGRTVSRSSSTPGAMTVEPMWSTGRQEITEELYRGPGNATGRAFEEARNVRLHGLDTNAPSVTVDKDGATETLECDFVAGCDGFHGVSRRAFRSGPQDVRARLSVRLAGIMSETPPARRI